MIKKALTALAVAGALVFAGSAAANAYTVPPPPIVGDTTLAPGVPTTITITGLEDYDQVVFSVAGGATLASLVHTATATVSVTKPVSNGTASAIFSSDVAGTFVVNVSDTAGNLITSVTLAVDPSFADTGSGGSGGVVGGSGGASGVGGLPATGGDVPVAAIWLGVGAVGIGGIAVVAAVARRRAQSSTN